MPNHFHLLLRTPRGNLSIGMQWLLSTFATRFNQYRKESGHVFQGRYRYVVAPTLTSAAGRIAGGARVVAARRITISGIHPWADNLQLLLERRLGLFMSLIGS